MAKSIFRLLLALLVPALASAADVYVAQSGSGNASSCAQARTIQAGDWAAGNTIHLCGTWTGTANSTMITVGASGTAGNPITIKWETGAVLTAPAWSNNGAINADGRSYIVIDGNNNDPGITATANGSELANHINSRGIYFGAASNNEVKNLIIRNLYVQVQFGTAAGQHGEGIWIRGSNNRFHHNTFDHLSCGIWLDANNVIITGNEFDHNDIGHFNWGIFINPYNSGGKIQNTLVHDNHIHDMKNWDVTGDDYHHDGIFAVHTGTTIADGITGLYVYNNLFDGSMSDCATDPRGQGTTCATAWFYSNDSISGEYLFNNIFVGDNGNSYLAEGGYGSDTNFNFYNNVFDCANGYCLSFGSGHNYTFKNNLFLNVGSNPNYFPATPKTFDYNAYEARSGVTPFFSDAHPTNVTEASMALTNYRPGATSTLRSVGTNLTGLGITQLNSDAAGASRPSSAAWDIGAYQYGTPVCSISPTSIGPYTAGQAASQQFVASNCNASTFTVVAGSLGASGCSLAAGGLLNCPSPVAGIYNFTVGYDTATDPLSLTINAASAKPALSVSGGVSVSGSLRP